MFLCREVTAELKRLTDLLDTIHSKMTGKFKEKDDYLWELQRAITILRRKVCLLLVLR